MNKQEIIDKINKTKQHLTDLEQMLEKLGCDRWKPEPKEEYYYVNQASATSMAVNYKFDIDAARYEAYNCFETKEEAKLEAEKILVRRQLEDIARRLNKGQEINWSDENQYKWYIIYNTTFGFETYSVSETTVQGVVYCLDKNFLNTAIKEVGEGRLIKYLRGK